MLVRWRCPKAGSEPDPPRTGLLELRPHVLIHPNVGSAEPVDRLLRIADAEELARLGRDPLPVADGGIIRREQQQNLRLQRVGILKLVDKDVREALLKIRAHGGLVAHDITSPQEQIDEVQLARLDLEVFVCTNRRDQLVLQTGGEIGVGGTGEPT